MFIMIIGFSGDERHLMLVKVFLLSGLILLWRIKDMRNNRFINCLNVTKVLNQHEDVNGALDAEYKVGGFQRMYCICQARPNSVSMLGSIIPFRNKIFKKLCVVVSRLIENYSWPGLCFDCLCLLHFNFFS